jgi:hypothetical protein
MEAFPRTLTKSTISHDSNARTLYRSSCTPRPQPPTSYQFSHGTHIFPNHAAKQLHLHRCPFFLHTAQPIHYLIQPSGIILANRPRFLSLRSRACFVWGKVWSTARKKPHAPAAMAGHAAGINCMRGKKKKKKANEMIDSGRKAVEASVWKILAP